jgi:hypothetical protein
MTYQPNEERAEMSTFAITIIVEPDKGAIGEPGWWIWEVSQPDETRPAGRHVLAEDSARWRWLAIARALRFAWLSRNNRYAAVSPIAHGGRAS